MFYSEMLDPNISLRDRRALVEILATGLEVDPRWLADGPWEARKVLLGSFQLKDSAGYMHIGALANESDRSTVKSILDQGYDLRWERKGGDVAVIYYNPAQKARPAA
jgi:hypothetical protein